ncbi:SPOSA6832_02896, partial [Sporobolomyces salmonicolor]
MSSLADADTPSSQARSSCCSVLSAQHSADPLRRVQLFDLISQGLEGMSESEKKDNMKKVSESSARDRQAAVTQLEPQTNGIFEMRVKNKAGKEGTWTIDLKKVRPSYIQSSRPELTNGRWTDAGGQGLQRSGKAQSRRHHLPLGRRLPTDGKINGQKAFMSGKLKVKGNSVSPPPPFSLSVHPAESGLVSTVMLATKLDTVLKGAQAKL